MFYEGRHIGSVEFGVNIDEELVKSLKEKYGNDWRILLTREALSLATLEDTESLEEGPTPDLLILASTLPGVLAEPAVYQQALNESKEISQIERQGRNYSITSIPLYDFSGTVIGVVDIIFDQTNYVQAQNTRLAWIIVAGLLSMAFGAASLTYSTNRSLQPLNTLRMAAEEMQHGNFDQQVTINSQDEIGVLAKAFNTMSAQLKEMIGSLEQRVADRTRALASVADISIAASANLETDKILKQVVDLAQARFDLYHAHIYLLDEAQESLVLTSGAGEIGDQMVTTGHSIPLDREQSLVARTAREGKGVTVNDVTTAQDFLPNPLLPNTRSELAVPMMAGEKVIGVFDVQSDVVGRFTESDIAVQTTLASQVASAVQNARSYTELQRSQSLLSEALNISRLANWE
jgi:nitrate/nitrite-specific signal transduction histidine kinase